MTRSTESVTGFVLYSAFFLATTLIAIVSCIFWYMSPLGLGFAQWPVDADQRRWADTAYNLSYVVGLPLLVAGQVASAALESKGRRGLAYIVPSATILFFLANVSVVLALLEP